MIQIKVINEEVQSIYFGDNKKDGWIELQSIPDPEEKEGYTPVMYYRDNKIVYEYEPLSEEPTEEISIDELKRQKIDELNTYYNNDGVNQFFINDIPLWLDPTLRGNIQRQIEANVLLNNPTTNLPINGVVFPIPNDTAKIMLAKLELYAGECYNVREAKEKEINAFQTKEEIEKYDVTIGYPEKLKFEL